jgi:hypothetical protein
MAIVLLGITPCPICGCPVGEADDYTATSGCAFPSGHALYPFCDAPLHFDCLENWPLRQPFAQAYFDRVRTEARQSPGRLLIDGELWILVCGPAAATENPYYVEARRRDWPMRLYSRWEDWEDFLAGGYAANLQGQALQAASEVIQVLRDRLPDQMALAQFYKATRTRYPPAALRPPSWRERCAGAFGQIMRKVGDFWHWAIVSRFRR